MSAAAARLDGGESPAARPGLPPENGLADSGLGCLAVVLGLLGRPVDRTHLDHQFRPGPRGLSAEEVVRAARASGLKAGLRQGKWEALAETPRPAIAELRGGGFLLMGAADDERIAIIDPSHCDAGGQPQGQVMERAAFEAIWTGRMLLLTTRAPKPAQERGFGLAWFLPSIVKYRSAVVEMISSSLALQFFALVTPIALQVVIDKVLVHQAMSTLEVMAVILLAMAVFEALLGWTRIYLLSHTSNRIDVELGARLFAHLMALPMQWFQARQVGGAVARVRELETIRSFLTGSALTIFVDVLFTLCFLGAMLVYSPVLTAVVAATLPIYIAISIMVTPVMNRRLAEKFQRNAENQSFLTEALGGIETLKSMAVEPQLQRRWEEQLAGYVDAAFRATCIGNLASHGVGLVNKLCTVALLWFGAQIVMGGSLTVGELVAVNMFAAQVTAPVLRLATIWIDFQQVRLSMQRLGDILDAPREPTHGDRPTMPSLRGDVVIDRVTFRYRPQSVPVLKDFSLRIPAGQVLGVVGVSGSGKSTVSKLIQGLHPVEAGQVLVDGIDIASVNPASLRRQIGVVMQENVLFSGTIRENIALADPAMSLERVVAAAKLAGAHDFISRNLPDGYATVVGERGAALSGGQRQRIALARALVGDPRLLVLDEATSALDAESEAAILDNLPLIARQRTVVIIAHRFSTLATVDRIVVVEDGRVLEDGTHAQLVTRGGRYAELHARQAGPRMPVVVGA